MSLFYLGNSRIANLFRRSVDGEKDHLAGQLRTKLNNKTMKQFLNRF